MVVPVFQRGFCWSSQQLEVWWGSVLQVFTCTLHHASTTGRALCPRYSPVHYTVLVYRVGALCSRYSSVHYTVPAYHVVLCAPGIHLYITPCQHNWWSSVLQVHLIYTCILEGTARYAGLLLAHAEGFGLWLRLFFALQAKKEEKMQFS